MPYMLGNKSINFPIESNLKEVTYSKHIKNNMFTYGPKEDR